MKKYKPIKIGDQFGRWTVVGNAGKDRWGRQLWLCKCNCSAQMERPVSQSKLNGERSQSCGCLGIEALSEGRQNRRLNIEDRIYGRLKVVSDTGKSTPDGRSIWLCYCDPELGGCGKTLEVVGKDLQSGKTRSCKCLSREKAAQRGRLMGMNTARHELTLIRQQTTGKTAKEVAKELGYSAGHVFSVESQKIKMACKFPLAFRRIYDEQLPDGRRSHMVLCGCCATSFVRFDSAIKKRKLHFFDRQHYLDYLAGKRPDSEGDYDNTPLMDAPRPPKEKRLKEETKGINATVKLNQAKRAEREQPPENSS